MFLLQRQNNSFEKDVFLVLVLHVLIFLFLFVLDLNIFENKEHQSVRKIKSAVRIDIVSMPKLTLQELKQVKEIPDQVQKVAPQKTENNQQSKVDYLKKSSKVDLNNLLGSISKRKVDKVAPTKKNKKYDTLQMKQILLEGNKISAGESITGDKSEKATAAFDRYLQKLPSVVRPYWKLPSYLMGQNLRCRVKIFISRSGDILKTEIFESSGKSEYDQRALSAIKSVKQFPVPDNEILSYVVSGRVVLGFPL